jgi:hypothetical protein
MDFDEPTEEIANLNLYSVLGDIGSTQEEDDDEDGGEGLEE